MCVCASASVLFASAPVHIFFFFFFFLHEEEGQNAANKNDVGMPATGYTSVDVLIEIRFYSFCMCARKIISVLLVKKEK